MRLALYSAVAVGVLLSCTGGSPGEAPRRVLGEEVAFAGTVERSELMKGGRRFSSGPQGLQFVLEEEPGTLYHYFLRSTDEALAVGALRSTEQGVRFGSLEDQRVEGTARVTGPRSLEVLTIRPAGSR